MEMMKYSMASYGAHFCEVRVHEETGELRLSRWLGSFDCGTVVNPKTTASQLRGGIVMGIGMALTEETLFDERRGRIMNPSLAGYHVPVNLDVPRIDIIYTGIPDEHTPLGARGIGEIGITGAAAAIRDFSHHSGDQIINDGTITAGYAGGHFAIYGAGSFTNLGSVLVSNLETLGVRTNVFTNAGLISASGGADVNIYNYLAATFTNSGTISSSGNSQGMKCVTWW